MTDKRPSSSEPVIREPDQTSCAQCGDEFLLSHPPMVIEHGRPFCNAYCSQTYLMDAFWEANEKESSPPGVAP